MSVNRYAAGMHVAGDEINGSEVVVDSTTETFLLSIVVDGRHALTLTAGEARDLARMLVDISKKIDGEKPTP